MGKEKVEYGPLKTEAGGLLKIAVYNNKKKGRTCEYHACTGCVDGKPGSSQIPAMNRCWLVGGGRELDVCEECLSQIRETAGFAAAAGAEVVLLGDEDQLKYDLKALKVRMIVLAGQMGDLRTKVNKGDKASVPFLKGLQQQYDALKVDIDRLEKQLGQQVRLHKITNDEVTVVMKTGDDKVCECEKCHEEQAVAKVTFHEVTKHCCSACVAEIQQESQFAKALRRQSSAEGTGLGPLGRLQRRKSDPEILSARSAERAAAARRERERTAVERAPYNRASTVANLNVNGDIGAAVLAVNKQYGSVTAASRNRSSTLDGANGEGMERAATKYGANASNSAPLNGASNYGKIGFSVPQLDLNYGTVKIYDSTQVREPCEKCGDRPFEAKVTTSKGVKKWCKPCVIAAKERKKKEKMLKDAAAPVEGEGQAPAASSTPPPEKKEESSESAAATSTSSSEPAAAAT